MTVDPLTGTSVGGVLGNPSPRWARVSLRTFEVTVSATMMPATATSQPLTIVHTTRRGDVRRILMTRP